MNFEVCMPRKVNRNIKIETITPYFSDKNTKLNFSNVEAKEIINPFKNILDLVEYYYEIYKNNDIDKLLLFLGFNDSKNNYPKLSHNDMYLFIVDTLYNTFDPETNDEWLVFDTNNLNKILSDKFFDEYNNISKSISSKRIYPLLEVYTFLKLESFASTKLPEEKLYDVSYIWLFDDFIKYIYKFGFHGIISTIYKSYGFRWFINPKDSINYKWATYAINSCRITKSLDIPTLKYDLLHIYSEFIISLSIKEQTDLDKEILLFIKDSLLNFDKYTEYDTNNKIKNLENKISSLQKENKLLISREKQLNEGMTELRRQIKDLQKSHRFDDFSEIDEIAYKLQCFSPQNNRIEGRTYLLNEIWYKLSDNSKKDIKVSFFLFDEFKCLDLSVFPLLRCLESEFTRNFFKPFHANSLYKNIKYEYCNSNKYKKIHDALMDNGIYPTLGNLSFISNALKDIEASRASNIIKTFSVFLGRNKINFISICSDIEKYRIGMRKYKLVDIRNGIAHGDEDIIKNIDEKCYSDICKLIYEPPIQILYKIIKYSML